MPAHPYSFRLTRQQLSLDLELTNKCHLSCAFCPRDKTPKTGFMAEQTFATVLDRVEESPLPLSLVACGLGEPLLHPGLVDFVQEAARRGHQFAVNAAATLLDPGRAEALLAAGLTEMRFSITGTGAAYEAYYGHDFASQVRLVREFRALAARAGRCRTRIVIVLTREVYRQLDDILDFWGSQGFGRDDLILLEEHNRSGSYSTGPGQTFNYRAGQHGYRCPIPFVLTFVGWNGNYYLCALDWEKKTPFGNVFADSIAGIMERKQEYFSGCEHACGNCSQQRENYLHDISNNPFAPPRQAAEVYLQNDWHHQRLVSRIMAESFNADSRSAECP